MIVGKCLALATGLLVVVTGCSHQSGPSGGTSSDFSTGVGQALTITAGQLLATTGGPTPVAFGQPAHGQLTYGPAGAMIYTPSPGYSGTDQVSVTTTDAVRLYATDSPPISTVGDVEIQGAAAGSAIAAVPGSSDELYGVTDRGPNVDGRTDDEKVLPVPDFNPHIVKYRLNDGIATAVQTIALTGRDGKPMVGTVDPGADTGETLVDINGVALPPSDHGLDTEGLVALPDGTFWVSDEYGPFIIHFDSAGRELARMSPFDGSLPRELAERRPNQGLEGLTITPDGSTLVAILQSALQTPGLVGSSKSVPLTRIVTINLATKAIGEYLYPLENPQKSGVAVSEITALSNTTFLVDERDGKWEPGADKKIYIADISGATDVGPNATVTGSTYQGDAGGLLVDGKPIETLIGVTTDTAAIDKLKSLGITVAGKTLKLDLGALLTGLNPKGEFFGHDKIEGLATPDGGKTLIIANDSDFGIAGIVSDSTPMVLKPKMQPDATPDTSEFLVVDTSKLPAQTKQLTVTIQVG